MRVDFAGFGTSRAAVPRPDISRPKTSRPGPDFLRGPASFVLHYARERRWQLAALFLMASGAASCGVAVQYAIKLLVDAMAGPHEFGPALFLPLALFVGLIGSEGVLWRCSGWLGCRTTVGIGVDVRIDLFEYLRGQPMRYFAENLAGSLGQRVTGTAGNFGALINTLVWRIVPPLIDFIGGLIVFATVDWRMMLALAGFVVLVSVGLLWFGERGRRHHRAYASRAGEVAGELIDVISNMWAVKAFSAGRRERERLRSHFGVEAAAQRQSWMYTEKARVLHDLALCMLAGGMLVWAVTLWVAGRISPGDVVVVSTLTFRILHGSRDMALSFVDAVQHFGFIEDTLKIIGQQQTVVDRPTARTLTSCGGEVTFEGVSFAYGEGPEAVHALDFRIPPGQKVGIVGPSGAGKSTLIHLLQRLSDVDSGVIRIDGQAITEVGQDSLRDTLAVVPQEILLFHRSVLENIRFARPDATDDAVNRAARLAACDGFVRRLPEGYATLVGERGIRLSGGQRQRIGIARAFLKEAPILVLDEATSALDTESEMEIQRAIVSEMPDRTVIAVAHRLSTLAAFDRVLVMQHGRIVQDGTPAELRARGGLFQRMWRLQSDGLTVETADA